MSATDLTFLELQDATYSELKVPSTSEAYPTEMIERLLNEGYQAVFNTGRRNIYVREASVSFTTIPDMALLVQVEPGDVVINVNTTAGMPNAGIILIGTSFIPYTGKTATTFTGCSNTNATLGTDLPVRPTYLLTTLAPDIDEQQIRAIEINSIPYTIELPDKFIAVTTFVDYQFTIFNNRLVLPFSSQAQRGYMQYFKAVVPMALSSDTPALIPNSYRQMLVFYATGRAMILDDKRTGWELYYNYNPERPSKSSGLFFDWLRGFYAKYGKRVDLIIKTNRSIYD